MYLLCHDRVHHGQVDLLTGSSDLNPSVHGFLKLFVMIEEHADDLDVSRVLAALDDIRQLLLVLSWVL